MAYAYHAGPPAESGFVGEIADAVSNLFDIFSGGPQKRERTAKAELEKAQAELAAAQLAKMGGPGQQQSWLAQPSFLGVPNWVLLAGAGVGTFLVVRSTKKKKS